MRENKRLIDANEAYEIARTSGFHNDFARSMADLTSLEEVLEDCTTVEAVEVVHGRWVHTDYANHWKAKDECGVCGFHNKERSDLSSYHYCPNCGAKMDGGNEDG